MSYGFDPYYDPMQRMFRSSAVKILILANIVLYVLSLVTKLVGGFETFLGMFGLVPEYITTRFFVWQFFTAMFLHGDFFHVLFNMLGLFFFGPDLEWLWGKVKFLTVYLVIGLAANLVSYLVNIHSTSVTIGSSGAVFGVLGAYAALYPNRMIIFLLFPIKAKYLILFYFIFSLLGVTGVEGGGGTAHIVHLVGILLGVGYVRLRWQKVLHYFDDAKERVRIWRLRRKYKNFRILDDRPDSKWDDYQN